MSWIFNACCSALNLLKITHFSHISPNGINLSVATIYHGRSHDIFSGEETFFQKFSKIFQNFRKTFKKYSKNIFLTFLKILLRKLLKCIILAYFSHKLTRLRSIFVHLGENAISRKFLRKLSKIFKEFLKKIAKMHYFSIFSKELTNHALIFCAFGWKTNLLKFLRKF